MGNSQGWVKYQFGLGIFLSAFLLFFIQPLLAKTLLPLFGGAGFVWVTCMLFFQVGLLVGYFYAYCLTQFLSEKVQAMVHFVLLASSFYFIPIDLERLNGWQDGWPPLSVAKGLSICILIPFAVISASSPLLQHWYCVLRKTPFPYYYYSISNVGSLLGLLGYPFLIEPYIGMIMQSQVWSWLYLSYAILCALCLLELLIRKEGSFIIHEEGTVSLKQKLSWLGLTILSSALLISTTRYFTQNVVNLPLAWVIPLGLYLISFIVTFSKPKGYERPFWLMLFSILSLLCVGYIYYFSLNGVNQIVVLLALMYSGCMICHGELIRIKPPQQYLTLFYLFIALGGALGGALANGISFIPFAKWWDFYLPMMSLSVLVVLLGKTQKVTLGLGIVVSCAWLFVSQFDSISVNQTRLYERRSIYGYMRIFDFKYALPEDNRRILLHGTVLHGMELSDPTKKSWPTAYYGTGSGVGLAVDYLHSDLHRPLKVGAIGLGTGTVAALLRPGDEITFYEIDPDVEHIANDYFSFLKLSSAKVNIVLGDGRIQMQKEINKAQPSRYDLIVIDAFTGDSIPPHLITLQAMQLYQKRLLSDGIIAFHITNTYIDLVPITKALAKSRGFGYGVVRSPSNEKNGIFNADWALLTQDQAFYTWLKKQDQSELMSTDNRPTILWTDDLNSILPLLESRMGQKNVAS